MDKFSKITQTEDPTPFPLESNLDSSIQKTMYKDEDLYSAKETSGNSVLQQPNLISMGEELELKDHRRNFANVFVKSKNAWCLVDANTKEIIKKLDDNKEFNLMRVRNNINMLKATFASLNIFEKEIIVWIRINYNKYLDKFDIVTDMMYKFNISESRCNYLIDSSGV